MSVPARHTGRRVPPGPSPITRATHRRGQASFPANRASAFAPGPCLFPFGRAGGAAWSTVLGAGLRHPFRPPQGGAADQSTAAAPRCGPDRSCHSSRQHNQEQFHGCLPGETLGSLFVHRQARAATLRNEPVGTTSHVRNLPPTADSVSAAPEPSDDRPERSERLRDGRSRERRIRPCTAAPTTSTAAANDARIRSWSDGLMVLGSERLEYRQVASAPLKPSPCS
jgi:hypothetical protein